MNNTTEKQKTPSSIRLIGIYSIYYLGFIFWNTFNPSFSLTVQRLGLGFTIYLLLSALLLFLCAIGLWFMKKWALYAYAGLLVINQIVGLILGRWNIGSLLIPAIFAYIGYRNFSKMS